MKDGHDGGFAYDNATLMVVPKPRGSPRRPGPPKYIVVVQQTPGSTQGVHADATPMPTPAGLPAAPQQQPAKQPPGSAPPPQSNAQPTKP